MGEGAHHLAKVVVLDDDDMNALDDAAATIRADCQRRCRGGCRCEETANRLEHIADRAGGF